MSKYYYPFIALLLAALLGGGVHALLFPHHKTTNQTELYDLKVANDSLLGVIHYHDLRIDSLEKIQVQKDGVIVKLRNDIVVGRKKYKGEIVRLDTINEHELTKEILDYYSN